MAKQLPYLSSLLQGLASGATLGLFQPFAGQQGNPTAEEIGRTVGSFLPALIPTEGAADLLTGGALSALKDASPLLGNALGFGLRSAGIGAAEGTINDVKAGKPLSLPDIGKSAAESGLGGALTSAAFDAAAPLVGQAVSHLLPSSVTAKAGEALGTTPFSENEKNIFDAFQQHSINRTRIAAQADWLQKAFTEAEPDAQKRAQALLTAVNPAKYPAPDVHTAEYASRLRGWLDWAYQEARKSWPDLPYWKNDVTGENYMPIILKSSMGKAPLYEGAGPGSRSLRQTTQHILDRSLNWAQAMHLFGNDLVKDPALLLPVYTHRILGTAENVRFLGDLRNMADADTGLPLVLPANAYNALKNDPQTQWMAPVLDQYVKRLTPDQLLVGRAKGEFGQLLYAHPVLADYLKRFYAKPSDYPVDISGYKSAKSALTGWKFINPLIHGGNVIRAVMASDPNPVQAILTAGRILGAGVKSIAQRSPEDLFAGKGLPFVEDAANHGLRISGTDSWEINDRFMNEMQPQVQNGGFIGRVSQSIEKALAPLHRTLWEGIVRNAQLAMYENLTPSFVQSMTKQGVADAENAGKKLAADYVNHALGTVDARMWKSSWQFMTSTFLFAPKWAPTRMGMAGTALTGLGLREYGPVEQRVMQDAYKGLIGRSVLYTGVVMDALNLAFTGHHIVQNDPRHMFEVQLPNTVTVGNTALPLTGPQNRPLFMDLGGWIRDYIRFPGEPLTYMRGKLHPLVQWPVSAITHSDITGRKMTDELLAQRAGEMLLPSLMEVPQGASAALGDLFHGRPVTRKDAAQTVLDLLQTLAGLQLTEEGNPTSTAPTRPRKPTLPKQ